MVSNSGKSMDFDDVSMKSQNHKERENIQIQIKMVI